VSLGLPLDGSRLRDVRDRRAGHAPLIVAPPWSGAMGKNKAADKQRQQQQQQGSGAVNTEAHVQVLGLGLDGTDVTPSVLLVFDKARFLFNAGEGFQVRARARSLVPTARC
jgi:hypothetical protein